MHLARYAEFGAARSKRVTLSCPVARLLQPDSNRVADEDDVALDNTVSEAEVCPSQDGWKAVGQREAAIGLSLTVQSTEAYRV